MKKLLVILALVTSAVADPVVLLPAATPAPVARTMPVFIAPEAATAILDVAANYIVLPAGVARAQIRALNATVIQSGTNAGKVQVIVTYQP